MLSRRAIVVPGVGGMTPLDVPNARTRAADGLPVPAAIPPAEELKGCFKSGLIIVGPLLCCRVNQLRSGGWEWTSTPFQPLQGFEAMPEYPEYSTGQHRSKEPPSRIATVVGSQAPPAESAHGRTVSADILC